MKEAKSLPVLSSQAIDPEELARFAKALAHPARIQILQFLSTVDACFVGNIVSYLPLAQSTVSQHLKVLKEAGLIQGTIEGQHTCYCIDPERMARFKQLVMLLP